MFQLIYDLFHWININLWNKFWIKTKHPHVFKKTEILCEGELFVCMYCGFEMIKKSPYIRGLK